MTTTQRPDRSPDLADAPVPDEITAMARSAARAARARHEQAEATAQAIAPAVEAEAVPAAPTVRRPIGVSDGMSIALAAADRATTEATLQAIHAAAAQLAAHFDALDPATVLARESLPPALRNDRCQLLTADDYASVSDQVIPGAVVWDYTATVLTDRGRVKLLAIGVAVPEGSPAPYENFGACLTDRPWEHSAVVCRDATLQADPEHYNVPSFDLSFILARLETMAATLAHHQVTGTREVRRTVARARVR